MSIADALSRISQIETQIAALGGARPQAAPAASSPAIAPGNATGGMTFADALSQAQGLGPAAAGKLTTGQQQFASRLAQQTGLDPQVVAAWVLSEESGSAATSRQSANNNDWLNIGYTDSGTYGAGASIWSDPTTAADATAGWLKGQRTVPGYGPASVGIRSILATAGQSPDAQIAAIQRSGWASSGYPSLPGVYRQLAPGATGATGAGLPA